ncbi:hypothetical protein [Tistrella mobilis]|uniref:Uncharacterized protein n=1 Tax=Tistrella mobilis (strain KA081020-065) TaxID=1110502 RepID=I3TSU4_TISMK|nr:hypothetical protein [Tistrella mobilis]AFK55832.1 hypothetical protein TMO_a0429 [Tistrella mobilis KA081020-065]
MDTQMNEDVAVGRRPGGIWSRPVLEVMPAAETAIGIATTLDGGAGLS